MNDDLKFLKLAHDLNVDHKRKLLQKKMHFRGNINSLSIISLSQDSPELGVSGLKEPINIDEAIQKVNDKLDKKGQRLGRPTPEKELQAWIILQALKNSNKLPFDNDIEFLTSELSIRSEKKIVTDILGYDTKAESLVIIELKSTRAKTEIENQVNIFAKIILDKKKEFFKELVNDLFKKRWSGRSIKKIIIWPSCSVKAKNSSKDITEYCYDECTGGGKKHIFYDGEGNIRFTKYPSQS